MNNRIITTKEIVPLIKDKFDVDFKPKDLQTYYNRHDIDYKKEMPYKSHTNVGLPIGSERMKSDGMWQIKVAPHKWEYKQRYIYEQYYGVELPDDQYVIFLDHDRNNFDINNLKVISRYEAATMRGFELFSTDPNLTECGITAVKVYNKTKDKRLENVTKINK